MIILRNPNDIETLEPYSTLKSVCRAYAHKKFSYHYLKGKKFPFEYKGLRLDKVKTK